MTLENDAGQISNLEMMDQAKESITRIEESTSRIYSIVNGSPKPTNSVRSQTRRRGDITNAAIRRWIILLTIFAASVFVGLVAFTYRSIQLEKAIAEISYKLNGLELSFLKHSDTDIKQP